MPLGDIFEDVIQHDVITAVAQMFEVNEYQVVYSACCAFYRSEQMEQAEAHYHNYIRHGQIAPIITSHLKAVMQGRVPLKTDSKEGILLA